MRNLGNELSHLYPSVSRDCRIASGVLEVGPGLASPSLEGFAAPVKGRTYCRNFLLNLCKKCIIFDYYCSKEKVFLKE